MKRKYCIICHLENFTTIYHIPAYPIQMWNTNKPIDSDIYIDFTVVGCSNCGCIQLSNVVDPSLLYTSSYSTPLFSSIWKEHHAEFSKFIMNNTSQDKFLEIGANAGQLYMNLCKNRDISYNVLDFKRHNDLPLNISCTEGSCEEFDYTAYSSIIMSHVFEHILDPHRLIKKMYNSGVKEVFISIPDFHAILENQYINILTTQHIFYCAKEYIMYLFSLYGYRYEENITFKCHSEFFKFVKSNDCIVELPRLDYVIKNSTMMFKEYSYIIKSLVINQPTYICPGGMFGQMVYLLLDTQQKDNIIGFIDGDIMKNNTRLYGTDKLTYSPGILQQYTDKPVNIIIMDNPYIKEIYIYLNKFINNINLKEIRLKRVVQMKSHCR